MTVQRNVPLVLGQLDMALLHYYDYALKLSSPEIQQRLKTHSLGSSSSEMLTLCHF